MSAQDCPVSQGKAMHGLINRSIQSFVCDTYGRAVWLEVTATADIGFDNFEALLTYDDALTQGLIDAITVTLDKPADTVLEDIGTYLVSHRNLEPLRRLLRFGGVDFREFLHSLDDLHDRAKLAVPDLDIPRIEVTGRDPGVFGVTCRWTMAGFGHVLVGILRAMADDYGDLVFLEHEGSEGMAETVKITLVETAFAEGRSFDLPAATGLGGDV